jgi:D-alanyl-D-alanine carboxypeptidase
MEPEIVAFAHENGVPGVSIGFVIDGRLVRSVHVGAADLTRGRRPDDATLYRIASITKTFTATAILQLRDAGKLALDDPLVHHLPAFAAAHNPFGPIEQITLLRILRHMSGLPGEMPSTNLRTWRPTGGPEVVKRLASVTVAIPPDTAFKYSNLGYHLLGEVVTRVSGRSLSEYVKAEITDVLSMDKTTFEPVGPLADHMATGYDRRSLQERLTPARRIPVGESEGNGGLWSNVHELGLWVGQQLRRDGRLQRGAGQVLSGSTLGEMHRPAIVAEPDLSAGQGLAWRITRLGESTIVEHGGLLNGFSSSIQFSPADGTGVVVLMNGVAAPRSATELGRVLLREAIAGTGARRRADRPLKASAAAPRAWRELVGRYLDEEFRGIATVEIREGRLVLIVQDEGIPHVLTSTSDALRFTLTERRPAGEELVFFRDEALRIAGLNFAGFPMRRLDLVP